MSKSSVESAAWVDVAVVPSKASAYLTQYSAWRADQALGIAKSLKAQTRDH